MKNYRKLFRPWPVSKFKGLTLVLILFIALLLPLPLSKACGPVYYEFSGYSFLNPKIISPELPLGGYLLNFENLYKSLPDKAKVQLKGNLEEWRERFCNIYSVAEIQEVVYNAPLEDLKILRTACRSDKINIPSRLFNNAFARHLKKEKCLEIVDYLVFAKECEPHVTLSDDYYWEAPKRDVVAMQTLIDEGRKTFLKTKSDYAKLRYAYQLVRLAHYAKDYQQTLDLYDFLEPKLDNDPSIIEDWMLGHKAGALMSLGQNVEASYLFSLIFQRCPSKRESAYRSFKIKTDEEWNQCQLLCQNDAERANLFVLRAQAEDSKAAEEMEAIYVLDPTNENLELLLLREIRKLEKDRLGIDFNDRKDFNRRYFELPRKNAGQYLIDVERFVRKCAKEGKVLRPKLWQIAVGYLEFLAGDLYAADRTFERIAPTLEKGPLLDQLEIFQLALKVNRIETMSDENEEMVFNIMTRNPLYRKYKDLPDFINDRMGDLYRQEGHPGLAFRCSYTLTDLMPNPQMEILDDLLTLTDSTKHNGLENALLIDKNGVNIRNRLLDMKGTLLMSEGKLEAAREVLKRIPRSEWDKYQVNPFAETMVDCVSCKNKDSVLYNKVELIDELFDLEYKAKSDMLLGGQYFYKMGLAFYNMSYFGNSWEIMDYFRSGANWDYDKDGVFSHWAYPFGNRENRDCGTALDYFERARSITKDPELAAKAAFMAARCEQNAYFTSKDCDYRSYSNQMPDPPPAFRKYFKMLKEQYAGTDFYQEAIKECKYFAAYAAK